jgi:hypothetical protein
MHVATLAKSQPISHDGNELCPHFRPRCVACRSSDYYPEEPELAACQRADAAYEAGDMFNFELWQRIAKTDREMLSKPSKEALLN